MTCKVDFDPEGFPIVRTFGTFAVKQIALSVEKPVVLSFAGLQIASIAVCVLIPCTCQRYYVEKLLKGQNSFMHVHTFALKLMSDGINYI